MKEKCASWGCNHLAKHDVDLYIDRELTQKLPPMRVCGVHLRVLDRHGTDWVRSPTSGRSITAYMHSPNLEKKRELAARKAELRDIEREMVSAVVTKQYGADSWQVLDDLRAKHAATVADIWRLESLS